MNVHNGPLKVRLDIAHCTARMHAWWTAVVTMYLEAEAKAKAEMHSEAEKLIVRYDGPFEIVKALMAYNCELETQILASARRHPGRSLHWLRRCALCRGMPGVNLRTVPVSRLTAT